jgi:hypothetical protein
MAVGWKCDQCGKDTHIHPPTEPLYDEKEVEIEVPEMVERDVPVLDKKGNKTNKTEKRKVIELVKKKQLVKSPRIIKVKKQNLYTKKMEEMDVHEQRDLFPRAFLVRLSFGMTEEVQRDFCRECLDKIMPKLKEVWDLLEKVEPQ